MSPPVDTEASRKLQGMKAREAAARERAGDRAQAAKASATLRVLKQRQRTPLVRKRRFDKWLQKCYDSQRPPPEELAEVARMVFLELAVFGEDEKVRLLAAKELRVEGGGREEQKDDGVLDEIRQDLARSQEESSS